MKNNIDMENDNNALKNIMQTLENEAWKELNKEGITKEDLELVDLDIAYEPVTPFEGADPCGVSPAEGGGYIVYHPLLQHRKVSEEELKIMRFRFLEFDPERIRQREHINQMFKNLNQ